MDNNGYLELHFEALYYCTLIYCECILKQALVRGYITHCVTSDIFLNNCFFINENNTKDRILVIGI